METEKYEMVYKIDKNQIYLRLLGENFFQKNKKLGNFIFMNKKYFLEEKIEVKYLIELEFFKIGLIFENKIYDKSQMFKDCDTLIKFSETNKEHKVYNSNAINVNEEQEKNLNDNLDIQNNNINSLEKILIEFDDFPDYSSVSKKQRNDTKNSTISKAYKELKNLQDIKENSMNLSYIFANCSSLKFISGISNWNIDNISDMSGMFLNCSSLESIPDNISNWFTGNLSNMNSMFANCSSLISLPDLSKWTTSKVIDMGNLFYNCSSIKSLPDISKWNTENVQNMSIMFAKCSSLITLPDISKWNTNNVIDFKEMFNYCSNLISLPDISKWLTNNAVNINLKESTYITTKLPEEDMYQELFLWI